MDQKEMKNIKKPAYGCTMAKGLFAGANWICIKCGRQLSGGRLCHPLRLVADAQTQLLVTMFGSSARKLVLEV